MRRERDEKRSDTTSKDSVVCWRRSITLVLSSLGVNVKRDIIISVFYGMGIIDFFFNLVMILRTKKFPSWELTAGTLCDVMP